MTLLPLLSGGLVVLVMMMVHQQAMMVIGREMFREKEN